MRRSKKRRIAIIAFSNLSTDPRVRRHIFSLRKHYDLTTIGYDSPQILGLKSFVIHKPKAKSFLEKIFFALLSVLGLHISNYWRRTDTKQLRTILSGQSFDVIIANDIETLPAVVKAGGGVPTIFDAHEYSPKEFAENWQWRLLHGREKYALLRKFLKYASELTTVCGAIRNEYQQEFDVSGEVIYNAPAFAKITPKQPGRTIRIIHHGAALRGRKLELMIEVMKHLPDNYQLDLMLMPSDKEYFSELQAHASHLQNVRFVPTVPTENIVQAISKYDIGLYLLYPSNFNNLMALPNKFFEFIQARLAIFVGPSPEMAAILKEFGNGVAISNFDAIEMAREIQTYGRSEIHQMKKSSARAAKAYCMENEQKKLISIIENLLKKDQKIS